MTVGWVLALVVVVALQCVLWTMAVLRIASDIRQRRLHYRLCESCARNAGRPWPPKRDGHPPFGHHGG